MTLPYSFTPIGQVRTVRTSVERIMRRADFGRGFDDVRAGHPPRFDDYAIYPRDVDGRARSEMTNRAWDYERGGLFACVAPLSMPLKIDGRLNPKAIKLFEAASKRDLIP